MKSVKETYRQFFNTVAGIKFYHDFKEILYSPADSLVQTLDNMVLQHLPFTDREYLQVCDIGGGDGRRISQILRYLHDKFHFSFHLDFIEQSKLYIDNFQLTDIDTYVQANEIHSLFEHATLRGGYDLVFLIHSIFALNNGNALDKVLNLATKGGFTIVVSNSPQSFLAGLKRLVDEGYDEPRYEIDALQRDLEARKIDYSEVTFFTRWAIPQNRYDLDINTILEEISLGSYPSFANDKKQVIAAYLEENLQLQGSRRFFCEEETVLILPPVNLF